MVPEWLRIGLFSIDAFRMYQDFVPEATHKHASNTRTSLHLPRAIAPSEVTVWWFSGLSMKLMHERMNQLGRQAILDDIRYVFDEYILTEEVVDVTCKPRVLDFFFSEWHRHPRSVGHGTRRLEAFCYFLICFSMLHRIGGSYTYVASEAKNDGVSTLAKPVKCCVPFDRTFFSHSCRVVSFCRNADEGTEVPALLFAGEHTHTTNYSTVSGAYLTGEREAMRVVPLLGQAERVVEQRSRVSVALVTCSESQPSDNDLPILDESLNKNELVRVEIPWM